MLSIDYVYVDTSTSGSPKSVIYKSQYFVNPYTNDVYYIEKEELYYNDGSSITNYFNCKCEGSTVSYLYLNQMETKAIEQLEKLIWCP